MTYPPPGGYDPRQHQPSSQPPQLPSDPYGQGHGGPPPPPPGYGPGPAQYPPPPSMTPPIGVQPGYPPGAPAPMPPQLPPPKQGGSLGLVLGLIVGLVALLGIAAVLIVPGLLEDDSNGALEDPTESPSAEENEASEPEPEPEETQEEDTDSGSLGDWSDPINSDDYDTSTPAGVGIAWQVAIDEGDAATMDSLMCSDPSGTLQSEYDYYTDAGADDYGFLFWGTEREVDGEMQVWAYWTWDDTAPTEDELTSGYIAVEEDGQWKLCDTAFF